MLDHTAPKRDRNREVATIRRLADAVGCSAEVFSDRPPEHVAPDPRTPWHVAGDRRRREP